MKRLVLVVTLVVAVLVSACTSTPVVVEKEVTVERPVVQTVVVEKEVAVEKVVVETVVVEREKVIEKEVVVEKVVTATPPPTATPTSTPTLTPTETPNATATFVAAVEAAVATVVAKTPPPVEVVVITAIPIPPVPASTTGSIRVTLLNPNGSSWTGDSSSLEMRVHRDGKLVGQFGIDEVYTVQVGLVEVEVWVKSESGFWSEYSIDKNPQTVGIVVGQTVEVQFVLSQIGKAPTPTEYLPTLEPTPTKTPPPVPTKVPPTPEPTSTLIRPTPQPTPTSIWPTPQPTPTSIRPTPEPTPTSSM